MKRGTLFLGFFIMIGIYQACTYKKTEYVKPSTTTNPTDTSTNNPGDTTHHSTGDTTKAKTVSFKNDIVPIFNTSCKSCHSSSNETLNLETNVYTNVSKEVNTTTPTSSKLYIKFNEGHNGATAAQATKVLTWIQEGATNN
jgi:hypothetical protein